MTHQEFVKKLADRFSEEQSIIVLKSVFWRTGSNNKTPS